MAWVRLDDQSPRCEKMLKAGPAACWLWVCGIAHSQSQLTDGFVSLEVLPMIGVPGVARCKRLADTLVTVRLFDEIKNGYQVHDYLDHNPSRLQVLAKRAEDSSRKKATESERNPRGIQLDSSAPRAGVPSHPIPSEHPTDALASVKSLSLLTDDVANRAGRFCEKFGELFAVHRHGARYLSKPSLDWNRACDLVRVWDDARLEKLAVIFLTTDDPWISNSGRGLQVFVSKASWCDDRLKAWELEHEAAG